jgi:hypothetical protein
MRRRRTVILGAAGRDFHNFNLLFRGPPAVRGRRFHRHADPGHRRDAVYPAALAGVLYPEGIPISPRTDLDRLIRDEKIDEVWFSYSDLAAPRSHASRLAGDRRRRPLRARLCTGAPCSIRSSRWSRSPRCAPASASRRRRAIVSCLLKEMGKRVVAVRHPMPYGDLAKQAVSASPPTRTSTGTSAPSRSARSTSRTSTTASSSTPESTTRRSCARRRRRPTWSSGTAATTTRLLQARSADHPRRPAPAGARVDLPPGRDQRAAGRPDHRSTRWTRRAGRRRAPSAPTAASSIRGRG